MNEIFEFLKDKFNLANIIEQPVVDADNNIVGFHCYTQDKSGSTISGGTFSNKETALRIAVAELIERYFFQQLCKTELKSQYYIEDYPSTCGFAAGFDSKSTRFRAICEGLERWVWSQWIDHQLNLPIDVSVKKYSILTQALIVDFDQTFSYSKVFQVQISKYEILELKFAVFLGCKEDGIFAGSRVSTVGDELWEHAVVEASRNFKNSEFYKINPEKIDYKNTVAARSVYFSKNKAEALRQVDSAMNINWVNPELLLLKQLDTCFDSVFIWRCLFKDYIGWHIGDEKRFVY
mgnify:CR=1 FL=1